MPNRNEDDAAARLDEEAHAQEALQRICGGTIDALTELEDLYRVRLITYCRKILNQPDDIEDAVQMTFLVVVQSVGKFRATGSVYHWLCGIARNTALVMLRKQRRDLPLDAYVADCLAEDSNPIHEWLEVHHRQYVHAQIQSVLKPTEYQMLVRKANGKTHEEIAEEDGVLLATHKKRYAKIIRTVRKIAASPEDTIQGA